eukprot:3847050-Rhodomonas_salina.1
MCAFLGLTRSVTELASGRQSWSALRAIASTRTTATRLAAPGTAMERRGHDLSAPLRIAPSLYARLAMCGRSSPRRRTPGSYQ